MAALKAAANRKRASRRDSESTLVLPVFRPPQLATLTSTVPTGEGWLFEMKYDGYRAMAAIAGDQVRIFTRNGHDWTRQFGYLVPALSTLTAGTALIDGEICALTADGRSDFSRLKTSLDGKSPIVFFAFDLLEQDGEDVAGLSQLERKARLEALLATRPAGSPIQYSQHVVGGGREVFAAMCAGGFEGLVAKSAVARYYGGERSTAWYKVKCVKRQEFVVIGWRPPDYGDVDVRGLFLATYEDGELVYRGGVGSGLSDRERIELRQVLGLIETKTRPAIKGMPKSEMRVARWVQPRLLCEVQFTEITADGQVRHPSFKGLREDKSAREVKLEGV
jgi:bifunctional non-homologous end joining protein LigD